MASCQDSAAPEVHVAPATSAVPSASASAAAAPRRPTSRHYLARTTDRCEVYSVEGDRVSPAERTPCPQDLEVGERIRVAGKTCLREGRRERSRPVVCPGPLLARGQPDAGGDAATP
ncbi:MAG: hypothetical protein IPM54_32605 [Polyangiaceae bacterium]|nr:hypothetical protein [Polyangiaceae bacterium]